MLDPKAIVSMLPTEPTRLGVADGESLLAAVADVAADVEQGGELIEFAIRTAGFGGDR